MSNKKENVENQQPNRSSTMYLNEIATKEYVQQVRQQLYEEIISLLEEQYMYPSGFCTRRQAMHLLNCSRTTLYRMEKNRIISTSGKGAYALFCVGDIKKYLQSHHLTPQSLDKRLKEAAKL